MAENTLLVVLKETGDIGPVVQKLLAGGKWEVLYANNIQEARTRVASVRFLSHILCDTTLVDGYGHVLHQEAQDRHPRVRFVALRRGVPHGTEEEINRYFTARGIPIFNRPLKAEEVAKALTV